MPQVVNKPRTTAEASLKTPLGDLVRFGPFVFDRVNGLLWRDGVELALPPRAIGVLARLIERAGDVVSKAELLDHVWKDTFVTEVSLTEAISLLRQTLDDDPQRPIYIQTQPRRGYRFLAPLEDGLTPSIRPTPAAAEATAPAPSPVPASVDATVVARIGEADEAVWPAWLPWVVSVVVLIALIAVSAGLLGQPSLREHPVARFAIDPGPGVTPVVDRSPSLAVSRDGALVAFVGRRADGASMLFLRELGRLEATPVAGTDGAQAPFFSPDGRWLGFFARGRLFKTATTGGAPIALCDAPDAGGAVWTSTNAIIFSGWKTGGLTRVSDRGSRVERVTTPDASVGEVRHAWPDLTRGDRGLLFTGVGADDAPESARLAVLDETGAVRTLIDGGAFGRVLNTGHLLFVRNRTVFAAPFDADALVVQGPPIPILDNVAADGQGLAQFAVTDAGVLAQIASDADAGALETWRLGGSSTPARLPFDVATIRSLVAAPTAPIAAAAIGDGHRSDIWLARVDGVEGERGRRTRLTTDGHNAHPVWTPDGRAIVFARRVDESFQLFARAADAASPAMRLLTADRNLIPSSIASDGGLFYTRVDQATGMDVWRAQLRTASGQFTIEGTPAPIVAGPGDTTEAAPSPDGRWLAWQSNVTGSWRVVVRDLRAQPVVDQDAGPSTGERLIWSDQDVAFASTPTTLTICHVGRTSRPDCAAASDPIALASTAPAAARALWRVPTPPERTHIEVVLEWSKELSARVPTRPKEVRPVR